MQALKTKWFMRFAKNNDIPDRRLRDAVEEVARGIIDADLGGGLVKKRIARDAAGKSGGYRTIIAYRKGGKAFFIFGFPKNEMDNIDGKDLAALKDAARQYEMLTEEQISRAVAAGRLKEIP